MENDALVTHFLDQTDAWTRDVVRRHGWAVEYVFGEGQQYPPVAYTVGLYGFAEHPELAIFGMDQHDSLGVLNTLGERIRRGARIEEGELITFDDWSHRLHVLPLVNAAQVLFAANRFYRRADHESVPGLQLVWDDRWGRFPWEPDYDPPQWLQPLPGTFTA
jgi:Domain of unknown function (DUF4262)